MQDIICQAAFRRLCVGLAVAILIAAPASAAVVIDDFTVTNREWPVTISPPSGVIGTLDGGLAESNVIGGGRGFDLHLNDALHSFDSISVSVVPEGPFFDLNSSVGARGRLVLAYQPLGTPQFEGEAGIEVNVLAYDAPQGQPGLVRIIYNSGLSGFERTATPQQALTGGSQVLLFPFAAAAGLDPLEIGAINVEFDLPQGGDLRVGTLQTYVPEPAALGLLGLLAPLALRRRVRRHG